MSDLGQRIRGRRAELGLTQKELADACKVKQASVSAWERGDTLGVKPENLYLASRKLRTSMEWLATGKGGGVRQGVAEKAATYELPLQQAPYSLIPRLGGWEAEKMKNTNKNKSLPDKGCAVAVAKELGPNAFALAVCNDAMQPLFPEGATIIVDPDHEACDGDYVVVEIAGEKDAIFKQLVVEAGHQYLRPLNTRYPVVDFDEKSFRICGVVRQMLMDFD